MNVHLLFAAQAESTAIIGKKPIVAKTANNHTLGFATTHPGATGISDTNAPAVPTNNSGPIQKIGLSAVAVIIISLDISLSPSPINWSLPALLPQESPPTLNCTLAGI